MAAQLLNREVHELERRATLAIIFNRIIFGFQVVVIFAAVSMVYCIFSHNYDAYMPFYDAYVGITFLQLPFYIAQIILVCRWLFLAFKNLPLIQEGSVGITPLYGAVMTMMPLVMLLRSYSLNCRLYKYSSYEASALSGNQETPAIISWLYAFAGLNLVSSVLAAMNPSRGTWASVSDHYSAAIGAHLVLLILLRISIKYINLITGRQAESALAMRRTGHLRDATSP